MNRVNIPNTAEHPKLIAHRGFAVDCPQNSALAFQKAGAAGFWAIETDIRKTRDGHFVCIHDPDTLKTMEGGGEVAQMSLRELRSLRFRNFRDLDETIPTLEEYLEICKKYDAHPFLETKTMDVAQVLETAFLYFSEEDVILSSIDQSHMELAMKVSTRVFLHHIFSTREIMQRLSRRGYAGVSYNFLDCEKAPRELLEETHRCGMCFCLRASDDPESFQKALAVGADYIPTNCLPPEQVKRSEQTKKWRL